MLNFIAYDTGVGGILIRAIEPTMGLETMLSNRPVKKLTDLTNGPGKLTLALGVNKTVNGMRVTDESCIIHILENDFDYELGTSHRIGVTKDLQEHFRFYVKGNKYVSK
jgi:DNA-3-methyladenine glycosylase